VGSPALLAAAPACPGGHRTLIGIVKLLTWWVGTTHYLWRAVDQHGDVLDILVQSP
jgi:hypothetical protein